MKRTTEFVLGLIGGIFGIFSGFIGMLIYSNIIGVGIMGFQRDIIKSAGYDAWISVLLSSISIHVLVWMTYRFLQLLITISFISINFALGNGLAGY